MKRQISLGFLALLLCLQLGADQPTPALRYLTPQSLDVVALLPDPAKAGSDEQKRELGLLYDVQQSRTDADIERAKSEEKLTVVAFADVLGPWFTAEHCPQTAALFANLDAESKYFTNLGKDHWKRPRPPYADERLKPIVKLDGEPSYPSGHSTRGMLFAEVLAEIYPDQRDALLARGRQIGFDRVIGGVHYPSDIYAGRVLGHNLARLILANGDFRGELDRAKKELAEARKPAGAGTPGQ